MGSRFEHRFAMTISDDGHDTALVVVDGDLDRGSVPEFEAAARTMFGTNRRVVVDITAATLVDSAALGVFIGLHRHAGHNERHLEILIGPAYQQVLFATAGLTDHLHLRTPS